MTADEWREWAREMLDLNVARDDEWMRDKLSERLEIGGTADAMLAAIEKRWGRPRQEIAYPKPPETCNCCGQDL